MVDLSRLGKPTDNGFVEAGASPTPEKLPSTWNQFKGSGSIPEQEVLVQNRQPIGGRSKLRFVGLGYHIFIHRFPETPFSVRRSMKLRLSMITPCRPQAVPTRLSVTISSSTVHDHKTVLKIGCRNIKPIGWIAYEDDPIASN